MVWLDEKPLPRSSRRSIPPWEAGMRSSPRLGAVNVALVALYFAPVWGGDGLRALTSPFHGFEDPVHASNALAGLKFVIAIGFLAYLIDFARALAVGRDVNRETLDVVLVLAAFTLSLWAWAALRAGDAGLIRLHATQFLLLSGAMIVLLIEQQMQEAGIGGTSRRPQPAAPLVETAAAA